MNWWPGEAFGLAWPDGFALLPDEIGTRAAIAVWEARPTDVLAFLETLGDATGTSLSRLPCFVVALNASDGWVLALRGEFEVETDCGSFAGTGYATWLERKVGVVEGARYCGGTVTGDPLPLADGIAKCGAFSVDHDARSVVSETVVAAPIVPADSTPAMPAPTAPFPQPSLPPFLQSPDVPMPASPASTEDRDDAGSAAPQPHVASSPSPVAPPIAMLSTDHAESNSLLNHSDQDITRMDLDILDDVICVDFPQEPEHSGGSDVQLLPQSDQATPADDSDPLNHLWGATVLRSFEDAAVHLPTEEELLAQAGTATALEQPGSPLTPLAESPQSAPESSPARYDEPDSSSGFSGDHDGHIVLEWDMETAFPSFDDEPEPGTLLGLTCPHGHANPPHRVNCRVCGDRLDGMPEWVRAESIGRVEISTGQHVDISSSVVFGRDPQPSVAEGSTLVKIDVAHISTNHVQLRVEGWSVLAVDLHSRNGTFLRRQGEPVVRLPDQPVQLIAGDILDLGQGVTLVLREIP